MLVASHDEGCSTKSSYHHAEIPYVGAVSPSCLKKNLWCAELLGLDVMTVRNWDIAENGSTEVTYLEHSNPFPQVPEIGP